MQAGLPPMVLAQVLNRPFLDSSDLPSQIWGLADMNGDGKMDINEFSIACKLINLKLKGMELPKSLPPQMLGQAPPNNLPGVMPMGNMGMGMPGGLNIKKTNNHLDIDLPTMDLIYNFLCPLQNLV